jgi:arylsulfatase A-like enzyme
MPTGATLATTLPPVGEGRLEGWFRAIGQEPVRVRLSVDGEPVFADEVPPGQVALPLGSASHPWVPLGASDAAREIVLEVEGSPGGLALFETPAWTRARSWKEDPNACLVVVGGLRADRLESYDGVPALTPALDAFAARSLRFADAWATSSWTLPSMATMLTSTFASQHLASRHDRRLGRGVTTLAEALRDAGYRTAAFTDGGFASPAFGLDRGFEVYDAQGGDAAAVFERATRFLEQHGDRPWFVLVHVADPQPPYEPPDDARAAVELRHDDEVTSRPPDPTAYRKLALGGGVPPEAVRYLRELYDEEVRATDRALGAFLERLEEDGLFRDALVAVTSDHGQELGEHGSVGAGDTLYPEVLRVPLLLKLPDGRKAGLIERRAVSLVDLAPTILDGVEQGGRAAATTFAGVSLISGAAPTPVFASREHPIAGALHLMRSDRHVFLRGSAVYHRAPAVQVFDVVIDPFAQKDVARAQAQLTKLWASRIEKHLFEHPPRVEGAENALSPRELRALDPLPDARPGPQRAERAPEGDATQRPRRGRQRKNR